MSLAAEQNLRSRQQHITAIFNTNSQSHPCIDVQAKAGLPLPQY
jgi:hypothetical protein